MTHHKLIFPRHLVTTIMGPILFLLLPTLAYGEMEIYVSFTADPPLVICKGHSSNLVTEEQREIFKINDVQLKNAVAKYSKQSPTDVFIKRETRFNLHKEYNWTELERTVEGRVTQAAQINCETRNWTLQQGFVNVLSEFYDSTSISTDDITVTVNHEYDTTSFNLSRDDKKLKINKFPVPFKPGKLFKCTIIVNVDFVAKLTGDVVVNYSQKRNRHHFWAFDVRDVQRFSDLPETEVKNARLTIRYGKPFVATVDDYTDDYDDYTSTG